MYIDPARLRAAASGSGQPNLDSIHQMIRVSTDPTQLARLLDQYIMAIAIRADLALQKNAALGAPLMPGASVLSAAMAQARLSAAITGGSANSRGSSGVGPRGSPF